MKLIRSSSRDLVYRVFQLQTREEDNDRKQELSYERNGKIDYFDVKRREFKVRDRMKIRKVRSRVVYHKTPRVSRLSTPEYVLHSCKSKMVVAVALLFLPLLVFTLNLKVLTTQYVFYNFVFSNLKQVSIIFNK